MCTSYFLLGDRPFLGLNFDFDRQYKIGFSYPEVFGILLYYGSRFGRPFGIRRDGTSANMQIAPPSEDGLYRADIPDGVTLHTVLQSVLRGDLTVPQMPRYFSEHTVLNVPDGKAHVMMNCSDGSVFIAEPGHGVLDRRDFHDGFLVMTNFHLWDHRPLGPHNVDEISCFRYRTAYRMLKEESVGVERGLAVLDAVKRTSGRLPTIFSLVTELGTNDIYFALYGDFTRIFRFSFSDRKIATWRGFSSYREQTLTCSGITPDELGSWQ